MAVAPVSHSWFLQWAPPASLFGNPSNINHQSFQSRPRTTNYYNEFHHDTGPIHPPADPYRGYNYGPSGGGFLSQDPRFKSSVLPGSQNVVGDNDDLSLVQDHENPFTGQSLALFQPDGDLFPNWQSQQPSLPRRPPQKLRSNQRQKSQGSAILGMLPALLAANIVGGDRGDQVPPADPDRDLGGPSPLRTLYQWNLMDFDYKTDADRQAAIKSKEFIPINTLPLGLEAWSDKVFVTFPRWKAGVPCTLATVPRSPPTNEPSPKLKPYPDWSYHQKKSGDCSGLTSIFRISADRCGRLWVLDSGQVEALTVAKQICPPQLLAFDLNTDTLIGRWPIPEEHVRQNSLFSNIIADIRGEDCGDAHIYFTDVWRFSILVFRLRDEKFWRFNSHLFYPDPLASDYTVHDINFQWSDGVFGIALTPVDRHDDRILFFHPMSSFREFMVPASILRNQTAANDMAVIAKTIRLAGESRGYRGQSSASAIDRNGIMFFNLVTQDAVGCWDTRKPYKRSALGIVARDAERLEFPNDLKIDGEEKQSVWILSNKLPVFLYSNLDPKIINFRIMREYTEEAIAGSVCDPRYPLLGPHTIEPECY